LVIDIHFGEGNALGLGIFRGKTFVDRSDLSAGTAQICIDCSGGSVPIVGFLRFRGRRDAQSATTMVEELRIFLNSVEELILIAEQDILG
jgi:hypothetical protein